MKDFDQAEMEWSQSLAKASADLARLAAGRDPATASEDAEYMDADEADIDAAIQTEKELEQKTAQRTAEAQKFLDALKGLRSAAAEKLEQDGKPREGSRTPRRNASGTATIPTYDLTKEGAKESAKGTATARDSDVTGCKQPPG